MAKYLSYDGLTYLWTKIKEYVDASSGGGAAEISTTTLETSKWSSGQYSFESTYPASTYDLDVAVNSTATIAQITAYKNAMLVGSAISNVLTAKGIVPTVDIPVILKAVKK